MGASTNIPWATDTWNPWLGCAKFSTECVNCYADELDRKRFSITLDGATKENPTRHWGAGAPRHHASPATWRAPMRWNHEASALSGLRR
jgi:protein gp37